MEPIRASAPLRALLLASAATTLLAATSLASPEDLTLTAATTVKANQLEVSSGQPEAEWNCLSVAIGGKDLRAIMPRFRFADPDEDFGAEILDLLRTLAAETVLASTGDIGDLHQDGTIYGVEYKIFTNDPNPVPDPPLRMGLTGTLLANTGETIGTLYCFNEGQYAARTAALGLFDENIVWCGPLGHGGTPEAKALVVAGNDNSFHGEMKANGSFRVTGDGHVFDDRMLYGTTILVQFGSHTLGAQVQEAAVPLAGTPHTASWYADAAAHSFVGDVSILNNGLGGMVTDDGTPVSGLIHATGQISIDGNDIDARATFVAGEGVEFVGNACTFLPAVDELLAYATGSEAGHGVSIPGSHQALTGALTAPGIRISVSGSNNLISGQLQANRVRIMGTNNSLSNVYQP